MRFEKSKTVKQRSQQNKKRAAQLVASGWGSATGFTIFDHYKSLQDFCNSMGKQPEEIDVHVMTIANLTEICKLAKGVYTEQFPDGERLLEYDKIAAYFGRFMHLTMMIGGSGQNWNIPLFDPAMTS